jgi:hypothetical protein
LDVAAGAVEEMARIANGVHFVCGLAKNDRLIAEIRMSSQRPKNRSRRTGKPTRRFKQFKWTTHRSWSRERRVVAKAEWTLQLRGCRRPCYWKALSRLGGLFSAMRSFAVWQTTLTGP